MKSILIAVTIAALAACGGSAGNGSVTCTTTDKQTTCVDTSHVSIPGPTLVADTGTTNSSAKAPEKPATANLVPVPNPPIPQGQQTPQSADSGLHPATVQTACFNTMDATGCPTNPGEGLRVSPGSQVPPPCGPAPTPVYLPDGQVDLTSVVGFRQPTC